MNVDFERSKVAKPPVPVLKPGYATALRPPYAPVGVAGVNKATDKRIEVLQSDTTIDPF